jgi:hypothetical protein
MPRRAPSPVIGRVLLLGLIGGLLIAILRFTEYQFLVIQHSFNFMPHMMDNYFAAQIQHLQSGPGTSAANPNPTQPINQQPPKSAPTPPVAAVALLSPLPLLLPLRLPFLDNFL